MSDNERTTTNERQRTNDNERTTTNERQRTTTNDNERRRTAKHGEGRRCSCDDDDYDVLDVSGGVGVRSLFRL